MSAFYGLPAEGIIMNKSIKIVTKLEGQFQKAYSTDGAYDILAAEKGYIRGDESKLISTGLQIAIPEGYVGIIKSRSGLSVKEGIDIGAGVIDCGYTGEVKVLLRNTNNAWFYYHINDKIAQMLIIPICSFEIEKVKTLEKTERAESGFNSTGY